MNKTLPDKNYNELQGSLQVNLPLDVGILIARDDPVRLLLWMLKQLDLSGIEKAYQEYCQRRRVKYHEREKRENGANEDEQWFSGMEEACTNNIIREIKPCVKTKSGRPQSEVVILLGIIIYGYMSGIYSSRKQARC
jgi:transposase